MRSPPVPPPWRPGRRGRSPQPPPAAAPPHRSRSAPGCRAGGGSGEGHCHCGVHRCGPGRRRRLQLSQGRGGHPGVAHEDLYLPGETKGKPPGGTGGLPNADAALLHPGQTRGVGAPDLGLPPQGLDDPLLLFSAKVFSWIQQSKDGAHAHTSSSAATGALV